MKWLHNGRELVDSDKYEMVYFESTGTARLIVKDVKSEDVGEYECFVAGNVIEEHTGRIEPKTIFTKAEITGNVFFTLQIFEIFTVIIL